MIYTSAWSSICKLNCSFHEQKAYPFIRVITNYGNETENSDNQIHV